MRSRIPLNMIDRQVQQIFPRPEDDEPLEDLRFASFHSERNIVLLGDPGHET